MSEASPCPVAARHAGQGDDEVALEAAGGGLAEDVEAVADLGFLQVAEEGVDACRRLSVSSADEADVAVEAGVAGEIEDALAQVGEAAAVHAGGGVVLVEQRLEVLERTIGFGAGERRDEVIDDHRAGAALGLGALAGVVDDERVELRQLGPERGGIAGRVERRGLAGQPFEIAVLAVVDHGVGGELVAQPEIGGEIGVRRHEVGVVVAGGLVEMVAAGGLQQDGDVAEAERGEVEVLAAHERDRPRARPSGR